MKAVTVIQGTGSIVLGQPHSGTDVPEEIWANLNETGRKLLDTDWHIPRLYEGLLGNVTIVRANFSRYVIDANRNPEGGSLYPGQNTTDLVPLTTFDGEPIWKTPPTEDDVSMRRENFHRHYHDALTREIERVKSLHGAALLYDCHSIRSKIPHLFGGQLPDLNIGTNDGKTCGQTLSEAVENCCAQSSLYSFVMNGRFKGGWTTRHYGKPSENIHAIQMEIAQRCYLKKEELPFDYDTEGAAALREKLRSIFEALQDTINKSKMET